MPATAYPPRPSTPGAAKYALTSVGLIERLNRLLDLSGLEVIEAGSGTGRATLGAARKAGRVTAVDIFEAVLPFSKEVLRQAGLRNVDFIRGDCNHLPVPESTFDVFLSSWAVLSFDEVFRVLKPGGTFVLLGPVPGNLCGELTPLLSRVFPEVVTEIAAPELFDPGCPDVDTELVEEVWEGMPVIPPVRLHDFTYISDYGSSQEAAAITGRLYGPQVKRYLLERRQSTLAWRLRVSLAQVRK
jgi:SAM-dependent methyltransferase